MQASTANPNLRNSTPAISRDPRGAEPADRNSVSRKDIKNQEKEQKKLEKQRLADQKKQSQEQAKQEKLMKAQAKKDAQKAKSAKKSKAQAPKPKVQPQTLTQPQSKPETQPVTQPQPQTSNPVPLQPAYSTNTLDSSISRSSGPPPYSEMPKPQQSKDKSNVVYSKPIDNGSWDIISQHREQISRPAGATSTDAKRKQVIMDLNYNFGATSNKIENSEA